MRGAQAGKANYNYCHGHNCVGAVSPEYHSWAAMVARCTNPKHSQYKFYGAKGITVCSRWRSFENFLADMGLKPSPEMTLDRKDGSKGYRPSNCRWADKRTQIINRSNTIYVQIGKVRKPLVDWCREIGVTPDTIYKRARRRNGDYVTALQLGTRSFKRTKTAGMK